MNNNESCWIYTMKQMNNDLPCTVWKQNFELTIFMRPETPKKGSQSYIKVQWHNDSDIPNTAFHRVNMI